MKRRTRVFCCQWLMLVVGLCVCSIAGAQQLGKKLGSGLRIFPEISIVTLYDDNFFYTTHGRKIDAYGMIARPALAVVKEGGRYKLQGGGRAEIGRYDTGGEDDYEDTVIFAQLNYDLTARNRLRLRLEREDGHDPFGRLRTEGGSLADRSLDEYHTKKGNLRYRFGAPGAKINLEYSLTGFEKEYDSNRSLGTRFLDYNRLDNTGTVFYNYSPKTTALLRFLYRDRSYDNDPASYPNRDSKNQRVLLGVTWRATAQTSGQFLIGALRRNPDDSAHDSTTALDWDIRLNWTPRRTTTLVFTTGRDEDASFVFGAGAIDTQSYRVAWLQQWTHRFNTSLGLNYFDQNFVDISRQDDFYRADLEGDYKVTRKLSLFALLSYIERESSAQFRDFSKNIVSFGFKYAP